MIITAEKGFVSVRGFFLNSMEQPCDPSSDTPETSPLFWPFAGQKLHPHCSFTYDSSSVMDSDGESV